MEPILRGILEFQQSVYPEHRALFHELRNGQSPKTMLITCSDSRIDPALIMRTKPGDIFIVRNAGNIVAPADQPAGGSEAASIEYATVVLGIEDIIVCGHSQCGAMTALLKPETLTELGYVQPWVEQARAAAERCHARARGHSEQETLDACIECNVILQLEHLQTYPFISERLKAGRLRLHGMVYHFEKGRMDYYEAASNRFVPLQSLASKTLSEDLAGADRKAAGVEVVG